MASADVEIQGNERVDYYVWATLEAENWLDELAENGTDQLFIDWVRSRLDEVPREVAQTILKKREELKVEGRTVETYRRIGLGEALQLLSSNPVTDRV